MIDRYLTAEEIIHHQKAFLKADAERMSRRPAGCPRAAWRRENPVIPGPFSVTATDATTKTRVKRLLSFDLNGSSSDFWVWSTGKRPAVIEHIDLVGHDADARLTRYLARYDPR